jgi:16S rRNA (cytosine967-C5)-methyltransferase
MLPAARIQSVIEILDFVLSTPRPADTLVSGYLRGRRFIGSKDRAAISQHFYDIMRRVLRLRWAIENAGKTPNARAMVLADLLLSQGNTDINEIFSGGRYAPAVLDDDERHLARKLKGWRLDDPAMPESVRLECPAWAEQGLRDALGADFAVEMQAMLQPAPLDLRVNAIKARRDDVLDALRADGFKADAGRISPLSIRIHGRPQIANHPLFRDGHFEIQDEGSQMVALLANAKPGEQVADFCAGAGGKTLALAASMNNKGRVIAMDVLGGRLDRAKERFRRAGLHNIETRALTSERDKYVKRHAGAFDLVLVDAPCSGVGTWRRDPDRRWRQLGPGLDELLPLQKSILESAARMVKAGGRLVYATCSLMAPENADQVRCFLAAHKDFSVEPVAAVLGQDYKSISDAEGFMRMTPSRHDTDGFFAACLVRKGG